MNTYGTKVSKSKQGQLRFPKRDKPLELSYAETKMNKKQLKEYLETGKLPKEVEEKLKKKRGRPKKMVTNEQAQELEKSVSKEEILEAIDKEIELRELEEKLAEASKNNVHLQNLLDDLQAKYNQLAIDYETAEQVKYDLTRAEGQRDQLKLSLKETEEVLTEEVDKREALERLVRLYV